MTDSPAGVRSRGDVPRSVLFSFRVLEAVAAAQPASLGDLARTLGSAKTTVLRALRGLDGAGYVFQASPPDSRWKLTLRVLALAEKATQDLGLSQAALPVMEQLAAQTEEAIHLNVLEGDHVVVVDKVDGRKAVRAYTERGTYLPPHASSSGKALLAELAEDDLKQYIHGPLERYTNTTITDPGTLVATLEQIRVKGYAVNDGERRADVQGVAAPIRDRSGKAIATLSVSMPKRSGDELALDQVTAACVSAALEMSKRLGW